MLTWLTHSISYIVAFIVYLLQRLPKLVLAIIISLLSDSSHLGGASLQIQTCQLFVTTIAWSLTANCYALGGMF